MGTLARSSFSLVWLLLWCPVERSVAGPSSRSRKTKRDDEDANKVALPHHSFTTPLIFAEVLNDWRLSGASIVERERLLLHPSVSERAAFFWNKAPLLTNDFEITMSFRVMGEKDVTKVVDSQSFAIWYVYENISASYDEKKMIQAPDWLAGLVQEGMSFTGFKSKFQGFGAVFSMVDAKNTPKAVVSGIWNDGSRDLAFGPGKDAPTADGKAIDFRNTMNAAQFRLRVKPHSVVGYLKQTPSLSWNECFNIDRRGKPATPAAGGYIGFTAWSGASAPPSTTSDTVQITQLEAFNFDTTSIGEEMVDVSKQIQEAYRDMLTDESRHFVDQKSQTEHLARLEGMLKQHLDTAKPEDEKMFRDLEGLQDRVRRLDENCKTLTKELKIIVGADGSTDSSGGLKDEIVGLRRLLTKDSTLHREKLETVERNIKEVKKKKEHALRPDVLDEVAKQTATMESTLAGRGFLSVWVMLAIIIILAVFGGLFWDKMKHMEKKQGGLIM